MTGIGTAAGIVLGISQTVYLGAMLTLGIRLALLARRTRQLPEALLAAHFLLCCTVGYSLQGSGYALAIEPGASHMLVPTLMYVGNGASLLGVAAVLVFNYRVFRRGTRLGRGLLAACVALLAFGYVGSAASGGFSHGRPEGFWFWLLYSAFTAASVWTLVEPLLYFAGLRKRQRIGLADPLVVDRFLLWGVGSVARFAMLAIGAIAMLQLTGAASDLASVAAPTFLASGLAGIVVAISYWLAFFPPRAYLRRVELRSASQRA
jgi:hypothetical protein